MFFSFLELSRPVTSLFFLRDYDVFFTFYFLLLISAENAYLGIKVTVHFSLDTFFDFVVTLSSYTEFVQEAKPEGNCKFAPCFFFFT